MNIPLYWRWPLIALAASFTVVLLALGDTVASLWRLWNDSDAYGHGLFVIPIVVYALWMQRSELAALQPRSAWTGLVLLSVGFAAWFVAALADIEVGMQLGMALSLIALVFMQLGWRIASKLWFALLFPLLAVPIWDLVVPTLQAHTANVVAWTLRTVGVPVYIEGFFIAIPSGNFEIAEVCAGLRYLLAMTSIAVLFAFLNGLTPLAVIGFIVAGVAWAILFNWIRVFGIVLVGHLSEMQSELVHDHYTYGWILFAVALIPLLYAGRLLPFRMASSPTMPAFPLREPVRSPAVLGAVIAGVLVGSVALAQRFIDEREVLLTRTPQFVASFEDWTVDSTGPSDWAPVFPGAMWRDVAIYRHKTALPTRVFVALYGKERQGEELINSANRVFDASRWTQVGNPRAVDLSASAGVPMQETRLRDSQGNGRLVWHTYRIDGSFYNGGIKAKLRQIPSVVAGVPSGFVVALSVDNANNFSAARARLGLFTRAAIVPIASSFDAALRTDGQ